MQRRNALQARRFDGAAGGKLGHDIFSFDDPKRGMQKQLQEDVEQRQESRLDAQVERCRSDSSRQP